MKYKDEYVIVLLLLFYLSIPLCLGLTSSMFAVDDRPHRSGVRVWAGSTIACIISLLLPPGKLRSFLGALLLLFVHRECPKYTSGKIEEDYLIAINVVLTSLKFVDFVYINTAEDVAHRVDDDGKPKDDAQSLSKLSLLGRLKWSIELFTTWRGIGWNWHVKNVDELPKDITRWAFARRQFLGLIYCYLGMDVLTYVMRKPSVPYAGRTDAYFALPLLTQVRLAWQMAFRSGFEMSFSYYLIAGIAVAVGLSKPQSWPPYFGSFIKGYTLRNIWGQCWHQNLRRTFETYSGLLCDQVGATQGSLGSAYIKLYASFLISAYVHHMGAINNPYTPAVKYQFWFFLLQPVAITIEDIVCFFWGSSLDYDRRSTDHCWVITDSGRATARQKAVGCLWVFGFLSFSLRYMAAYACACGFADLEHPITNAFSFTRYAVANYEAVYASWR